MRHGEVCHHQKRLFLLWGIGVLLLALIIWIAWGNTALELNGYTVVSAHLPQAFDGFRIAQVSDLHNTQIGEGNSRLLAMLRQADPDIIVITGDLIDSRHPDVAIALDFAEKAVQIAPCYYVTGNHEARTPEYAPLKAGLEACGVILLENAQERIEAAGEYITIAGVDDPSFQTDFWFGDAASVVSAQLTQLCAKNTGFTVLLSHRPELFDTYVACGMDLVFSGHAHGGQFRLPFIGGLAAPNQGLFPEYDSGLYTEGRTNMIVSRGIGNSIIPFRFNNPPEVILVELKAA